jgi:Zn-dependent protease with chaperone function
MIAIPLFMGVAIFISTDLLIFQLLSFEISEAFGEWFVYYLMVVGSPAFLAVAIGGLMQSRRYRIVNAVLVTFVVAGLQIPAMLRFQPSFLGIVLAILQMGVALTMAMLAISMIRKLNESAMKRSKALVPEILVNETEPVPSRFLKALAMSSVPLVFVTLVLSALITIGFSLLILMAMLEAGRINLILAAAGVLAPVVALSASASALVGIIKPKPSATLSMPIDLEKHPQVKEIIAEVAGNLETRMPDHVILNAQPGFFVTQGSLESGGTVLKGRILSLGLPSMRSINVTQLKAILAHEFAHFTGNDTAYSVFVAPVYRGIYGSIGSLQKGNIGGRIGGMMAILQYPSVQYLVSFMYYFQIIDGMLSRNRELRADWIAASHYGSDSFRSALKEVAVSSSMFSNAMKQITLRNDAELFASLAEAQAQLEPLREGIEKQLEQYSENEFDSHPSLRTRFESLPDFPARQAVDTRVPYEMFDEDAARLSAATVQRLRIPQQSSQ